MERLLALSGSPHIHKGQDTRAIMMWVLVALAPAGLAGVYFLGIRSAVVMAVCVVASIAAEYVWQRAVKQDSTVNDLSAAVTGLLLAYNIPPSIPLWMAAVGSIFSIIIVKQFFGGIGQNIMNPALAGRAMMLTSWPAQMTTWTLDGVTGATPLSMIKGGFGHLPPLADVFIGHVGGCIGETSALALLIGFALLLAKDIIKWHVPVIYVAVVAGLAVVFGRSAGPLYEICIGGLMLGAIFMATDYTTLPMTRNGQIIFAAGCGVLTSLIRAFGGYPEGVSYSIIIMNLTVPLIDKFIRPRVFGEVRKNG